MTFNIKSNELIHKIVFQRYELLKDSDGKPTYIWTDLYETRGKVLNVRGREYIQAFGTGLSIGKTIYVRYNHTHHITNEDRILYNNEIYNIVYVNNVEESNKWLEIKVDKYK